MDIIIDPETLTAAFLVGLLGGTHCLGMCGGIVGALSAGLSRDVRAARGRFVMTQLAYNGGRISSYAMAGILFGFLGEQAGNSGLFQGVPVGRMLGGVIMVLLGIYLAGWWQSLAYLERLGARLWRHMEPLGRRFIPVRSAGQAFLLGLVWGWLPCGMVYSVLALALSSGSVAGGGLTMLAFGLGTLPALMTMGLAFASLGALVRRPWVRTVAAILVILMGLVFILANPRGHGHHAQPHSHPAVVQVPEF